MRRSPVFMTLKIPKVAELNLNGSGNAEGVARLVVTVESHLRQHSEHLTAVPQLNQRTLFFGGTPDKEEANRRRRRGGHGRSHDAVPRERDVDAWCTASIAAGVSDVVTVDRHGVERTRSRLRGGVL